MSREVVVVSAVRTAIGTFGGSLKDIPPTELAANVVREALARARRNLKEDAPQVQQIRFALADCLADLGHGDEAARLSSGLLPAALAHAQPDPDWPARLSELAARIAASVTASSGDESTIT